MSAPRVRILLNPRAGSGAALRKLPEVEAALARLDFSFDVRKTEGPRDATRLVRQAAEDGIDILAVLGGDGTLNELAHAYVDEDGTARGGPAVLVVPAGTGGDYRKTLGLSDRSREAIQKLRAGTKKRVDLGHLEATDEHGAKVHRAFINITSFGIGGVTDQLVNDAPKWLGGRASFLVGAVRALAVYQNANVRVRVDGEDFYEGGIVNVAIALGKYFGGGMKVAPEADPSDGLFDVVSIGDFSRIASLGLTRLIYSGAHIEEPGIQHRRGAVVEAEPVSSRSKVLIDMDGETPGRLPLRATVVPGALEVFV
jgi:diacylglycerol kinase (ATP)